MNKKAIENLKTLYKELFIGNGALYSVLNAMGYAYTDAELPTDQFINKFNELVETLEEIERHGLNYFTGGCASCFIYSKDIQKFYLDNIDAVTEYASDIDYFHNSQFTSYEIASLHFVDDLIWNFAYDALFEIDVEELRDALNEVTGE